MRALEMLMMLQEMETLSGPLPWLVRETAGRRTGAVAQQGSMNFSRVCSTTPTLNDRHIEVNLTGRIRNSECF